MEMENNCIKPYMDVTAIVCVQITDAASSKQIGRATYTLFACVNVVACIKAVCACVHTHIHLYAHIWNKISWWR